MNAVASCGKLAARVAIVTGVSPNIGGGIAEALAAAGAAIVAVDADAANAGDCAAAMIAAGGRAIGVTCDVTDEAAVNAAVDAAMDAFGRVDILVNNAAIFNKKGVVAMTPAEWRRQCAVILDGTFLFTRAVSAPMIAQRSGVVINIVSTAGHQGEPGNIAYSTCKGGLLNFTRSAAMEFVDKGIRVVSLTPTATDPDEMADRAERWGRGPISVAAAKAVMARFADRIPMRRLPRPSDYGAAAVFLASDDAAMITGTDLRVDAGAVARYWAWQPADDALPVLQG